MKLYYDNNNIVRVASTTSIISNVYKCVEVDYNLQDSPIGKKIIRKKKVDATGLRIAVICNWGDACGIATYSKYLVDALRPLVSEVKIFAEEGDYPEDGDHDVVRCWKRGTSMVNAMKLVTNWEPSVVLIQHEFGIFPKAPILFYMLQTLDSHNIPYAITLHSVYEHLDKVICTGAMKNIIVHSITGEACLRKLGHTANIKVIPHGCVHYGPISENWNITHTPYAIMQFGFGFSYKGVDIALEAMSLLINKFPDKYGKKSENPLHYLYLCSESPHVKNINNSYYNMLSNKIRELDLVDHAVIIRGFQTNQVLDQYLRTYKLAIFPYIQNPNNIVYGASGAARLAMANHIPTIVSTSHMFDDLDGVLLRICDDNSLASQIDEIFSNNEYKHQLVSKANQYVSDNSWAVVAKKYRDFLENLVDDGSPDTILIG